MQASDIPYKFQEIWAAAAAGGYVNTPIPDTASGGSASQHLGFPPVTAQPIGSGGIPPDIADFNGVLQYATAWAQWFQAGAPVRYDATFQTNVGGYPEGAIVESASTPGKFWISTIDDNAGNPDSGSTDWRPWPWFQTADITTNTTLTRLSAWTSFYVSLSSLTVSLPAASAAQGSLFAFTAGMKFTLTSGGGQFIGGVQTGLTSLTVPVNAFIMVLSDGISWRILSTSMQGGSLIAIQTFAANGTYTPTPGMRFCIIECQGGGASGGGTQVTSAGQAAAGGGGGAGAWARGQFSAATIGTSQAVLVGASVAGISNSDGNNGNATQVGALIVAPGGLAGLLGLANSSFTSSTAGGGPSSASTGSTIDNNIGGAGFGGTCYAPDNAGGGSGGISHYGMGGITQAVGNGAAGPNYGSGGGGATAQQSNSAHAGGASGPGRVIVWEYS